MANKFVLFFFFSFFFQWHYASNWIQILVIFFQRAGWHLWLSLRKGLPTTCRWSWVFSLVFSHQNTSSHYNILKYRIKHWSNKSINPKGTQKSSPKMNHRLSCTINSTGVSWCEVYKSVYRQKLTLYTLTGLGWLPIVRPLTSSMAKAASEALENFT